MGDGPAEKGLAPDRCVHGPTTSLFGAADQAGVEEGGNLMTLENLLAGSGSEILTIGTSRDGGEYTIELAGELDLSGVTRASEAFNAALDSGAPAIVLDLRGLEFLDSTGVHAILRAERRASAERRSFIVVRGPRQVQRIFEISGVVDRLTFSDA
jgi:anti-anti-sigma factor